MTVVLEGMSPAQEQGWLVLLNLQIPDGQHHVRCPRPRGARRAHRHHDVPPARTVQVPGSRQALDRSQLVAVRVRESEGVVRRPSLLGALVAKAAATTIAVRSNPERDWEDAALLLSLVPDPMAIRADCGRKDLRRIAKLGGMLSIDHRGWGPLGDAERRLGRATLRLLLS
jgi:hypothetical protein